MTAGDGRGTNYHLNRLAGTLINGVPQYDEAGAAQIWAKNVIGKHNSSSATDSVNAIYAFRNGGVNYHWDLQGALNGVAGTTGLGEAEAAARIVS